MTCLVNTLTLTYRFFAPRPWFGFLDRKVWSARRPRPRAWLRPGPAACLCGHVRHVLAFPINPGARSRAKYAGASDVVGASLPRFFGPRKCRCLMLFLFASENAEGQPRACRRRPMISGGKYAWRIGDRVGRERRLRVAARREKRGAGVGWPCKINRIREFADFSHVRGAAILGRP